MAKKPLAFSLGLLLVFSFFLGLFVISTNTQESQPLSQPDGEAQTQQEVTRHEEEDLIVLHNASGMKPRRKPPPQNGDMTW